MCCGWPAESSSTSLKRRQRYSFAYFDTKTTQRAVPAKTCETGREDEGRGQLGVRLEQRIRDSSPRRTAAQSTLRRGSRAVGRLYGVKKETRSS